MKKNTKTITFAHASAELRVSDSTILRLVQRGTLHTTKPELKDGHWTRRICVDKAFQAERARRMHGLKAPRRKKIVPNPNPNPNREFNPADPSPIQTVTPAEEAEEKCRNAMNICLETQKACENDKQECGSAMSICSDAKNDCQDIKDSITRYQHEVDTWAMEKVRTIKASELACVRCTAILATACLLQLILAIYYTLCHFNII